MCVRGGGGGSVYLLIKTQVNIWELWLPGSLCKRTDMDSSASNSIDNRSAIGTVLSVGKERAGSQGGTPKSRIHRWDFVKMKPLLALVQMAGGGRGRHLESKEKGIPPPLPPRAFCRRWDSNHHLLHMPVRRQDAVGTMSPGEASHSGFRDTGALQEHPRVSLYVSIPDWWGS